MKKHFPDFKERVEYEKIQVVYYKSAIAKIRAVKNTRKLFKIEFLKPEKKDSINYFNGTGIYEGFQNPESKPNKFDTRSSFLTKMENPILREQFLKSYNRRLIENK